ncbi:MAG: M48 family metallopeptidase [Methylococcaceae bacterium]|jgi:predicted Zn-dependent protease|nr:M48 family metallopeptidase [Methylococcaceae bacterium]MDZ4155738.1 M48 family metallopeptidase [Methylococcales bacterium]MDP2391913.1 M48 family metallopeptidase [Methylococcaceae bacterium]MDP3018848.1 M48 family metallopeptidase [Methylococcaceae bacterium]MDP3391409.1 M48 family metallopeptidase [Methylococcaceae bacterium]
MLKKILSPLIAVGLLTACATSPTGRSQLIFLPDAQINQMGLQAFEDLKKEKPISTNARYNQVANCIAQAITQPLGGSWEVVVFEDKTPNAFALPGNKIGIHTGMLTLVDNQDQLAAVIGHEIGHVLAKHSNERASQEMAVSQGMSMVQAVSQPQTALGQTAIGLLGVGAQYGILMPYSRTHESEADTIGIDLMAKSGFDPRQSINLWQKMDQASQGQQPIEFMSTHPSHGTRIQQLEQHLPQAMSFYQQAQAAGRQPHCS